MCVCLCGQVETDNSNGYDHCAGGANCVITLPGLYTQKNGVVAALQTFPSGCPAACVSPRGSCTQPGSVCQCASGFLGAFSQLVPVWPLCAYWMNACACA